MASSSNCTMIALLVAFAVVAPSLLHQSAAVREAPAPSANDDGESAVVQPTATYEIPDLPLPRILPCPPVFPKIPFIPCHNVTPPSPPPPPPPPVKECGTSLEILMLSCSGFLTNSSSAPEDNVRPSDRCCEGVTRFRDAPASSYELLCLCHIANGDVDQLLTKPVGRERANSLVQACLGVTPRAYYSYCNDDSLKEHIPPMDLPKPPTPPPGNKA